MLPKNFGWFALAGAAALLLFFTKPAASSSPPAPAPPAPPGPGPVPPSPVPVVPDPTGAIRMGDSVMVPLLALFPGGAPFPIDPTLMASNETADAVRVLVQEVRPTDASLRGVVTAYHYGGPASDGWGVLPAPVPTPFFPASIVTQKLLTTR